MSVERVVAALELPASTRVDQRVPKKLLTEHAAATAADKRQIQDGVAEIQWLASLKPHLIGVPVFRDEHREYLEIAVLSLALKPGAKPARLVELLHRAVPYPMVLITQSDAGVSLSLVHLRAAQNERDKVVLDGAVHSVALDLEANATAPLEALSLSRQRRDDLRSLYESWIHTLQAFGIAREIGQFRLSESPEQAAERHEAANRVRELKQQLAQRRAEAGKEKQLPRQVALNAEIKRLQAEIQHQTARMLGEPNHD